MIVIGSIGPGWKVWLGTVIASLLLAVVAVSASVKIADRNTERQLKASEDARREYKLVTCDLVARILAGYEEEPPPTATGKSVAAAWLEEYRLLGCLPGK